jgi:hypothetical protein
VNPVSKRDVAESQGGGTETTSIPPREVAGYSYTEGAARPGQLTVNDLEAIVNGDVADGANVPSGPSGGRQLTLDEMRNLVENHNLSKLPDELIMSVAWKESSFNPDAAANGSTATGLMQMTRTAVAEVNRNLPAGLGYSQMTDPVEAIEAGSRYLDMRVNRAGGNLLNGLNGYRTGPGYGNSIINASGCLGGGGGMQCLYMIHH